MASVAISVDPAFGWVVIVAAVIAAQVAVTGGRYVGAARRKVFNAEFFRKAKEVGLLEEHKKATGSDKLPNGAYPDMGSGRYAALLPYEDWLHFNNAQRAHYNYVEGAVTALTVLLLSGLTFPKFSAACGVVYVIGRELYASGYTSKGANGRLVGTVLFDIALVLLLGGAIWSGLSIAKVV